MKQGEGMELTTRRTPIPSEIVEVWQRVVDSAAELLCVPSVMINRLEPPELEIFRSSLSPGNPFTSGSRMQMMGLYCEAAAKRRGKVQVEDARADPEWAESPTAKAGILAYLGWPLLWPDGEVFGTICAVDTQEHKWASEADGLLQTLRHAIEAHLALVITLDQLHRKNEELELALGEVKTLQGLLPICASCKKIRDDKGYWSQIDAYLTKHHEVKFSHGICPDCVEELYPDLGVQKPGGTEGV
jgi:hypothetical protein